MSTDVSPTVDGALWGASGAQPSTTSITKNPITYATATCQPKRSQRPTDLASGYMFERATPADDPNQIIGRSGMTALLMGSVATKVLHLSDVPVTLVKK